MVPLADQINAPKERVQDWMYFSIRLGTNYMEDY